MVMSNHLFEGQIRKLIEEAKSELSAVEAQRIEISDKAVRLAREIAAYETTLRGFLSRSGQQVNAEIDWNKLLAEAKTHKDRLVLIAKQMGGILKVSQATDILFNKGFIKSKKRANAYQIVQTNLANMVDAKLLEKLENRKGEYRVIDAQ